MALQALAGIATKVRAMKKGSRMPAPSVLAAHHAAPGGLKMKKPLAADTAKFHGEETYMKK